MLIKKGVFLKDYSQARILAQHPVNSTCPTIMIRSPPVQLSSQNFGQYFINYFDYMTMRGYLQNNSTNLNDTNELDQFIDGYIHSMKLFHISRDDRKSLDLVMLQWFLQGTLINTLTVYLRKLGLPNGPSLSSYCCNTATDDSDGKI